MNNSKLMDILFCNINHETAQMGIPVGNNFVIVDKILAPNMGIEIGPNNVMVDKSLVNGKIDGSDYTLVKKSLLNDTDLSVIEKLGFTIKEENNRSFRITGYKKIVKKNKAQYAEKLKDFEPSPTKKTLGKFLMMGATALTIAAGVTLLQEANKYIPNGLLLISSIGALPILPFVAFGGYIMQKFDSNYLPQAEVIVMEKLNSPEFTKSQEPLDEIKNSHKMKVSSSIDSIRNQGLNKTFSNLAPKV